LGIPFPLTSIFPSISFKEAAEAKSWITIHTSTSYVDCDKMFLVEFEILQDIISKHNKALLEAHNNSEIQQE
jgi:hypothetical protein